MTDPSVQRTAHGLYERLKASRHEYVEALVALIPVVEEAARGGDVYARRLLEEVERARTTMVSDSIEIGEILAGW